MLRQALPQLQNGGRNEEGGGAIDSHIESQSNQWKWDGNEAQGTQGNDSTKQNELERTKQTDLSTGNHGWDAQADMVGLRAK